jgi:hypothetical protein
MKERTPEAKQAYREGVLSGLNMAADMLAVQQDLSSPDIEAARRAILSLRESIRMMLQT